MLENELVRHSRRKMKERTSRLVLSAPPYDQANLSYVLRHKVRSHDARNLAFV